MNLLYLATTATALHVAIQSPPSRVINMSDALTMARNSNMSLRIAAKELQGALVAVERERPISIPSITTEAIGTLQTPTNKAPLAGGSTAPFEPSRSGKVEIRMDQLLYHPGGSQAREKYRAEWNIACWQYYKKMNDTLFDTRSTMLQLHKAILFREVAEKGLTLATEQYALAKTMLAGGASTERDVKASDSDVAEAEQLLSKARTAVELARSELQRTIGWDGQPIEIGKLDIMLSDVPTMLQALELARKKRAEFKILDQSIAAAENGVALAGLQNSPTVSARAAAGTQTPGAYTESQYLAGSLVLTWHPFDNARTKTDVKEAKSKLSSLKLQKLELESGVQAEFRKCLLDYNDSIGRMASIQRQIESAETTLQISRLRYEANSATQVEVSAAIFGVVRAKTNLAQAQVDKLTALAGILHAVGSDMPDKIDDIFINKLLAEARSQ